MFGKRILRVAAVGAAIALPMAIVATTPAAAAEKPATVSVLHAIPGSVLEGLGVAGGLVDVCANGSVELINDFAPGTLKTLEVAPGTYTLTVHAGAAGCASTPLLSAQATVAAGRDYTVTANLSAPPVVGPVLNVFVNNKAPITKYVSKASLTTGRVTVRHIAVAPAVDVFVNGNVAISGLTNPNQAQAKLKRGTYQVAAGLAGAGSAGIALGPVPLPVKAGNNVIVYAWGIPQSAGGAGVQVAVQYVKLTPPKRR
jgi:Domain of unknown function (DUF4397)